MCAEVVINEVGRSVAKMVEKSPEDEQWGRYDDYIVYSTRHMPIIMHRRLKMIAARDGISLEKAVNMALDIGLSKLERATG